MTMESGDGFNLTVKCGLLVAGIVGAVFAIIYRGLHAWRAVVAFAGSTAIVMIFGKPLWDFMAATYRLEPNWALSVGYMLGAFGWPIFCGLMRLAGRFERDPLHTVEDIKRLR